MEPAASHHAPHVLKRRFSLIYSGPEDFSIWYAPVHDTIGGSDWSRQHNTLPFWEAVGQDGPMATVSDSVGVRRWIVLGEDGRFVTLGRAADPDDAEIRRSEEALRAQGLAGWLAVMSGSPYSRTVPSILMVRPLAGPKGWSAP
jgi:hypothetical protein